MSNFLFHNYRGRNVQICVRPAKTDFDAFMMRALAHVADGIFILEDLRTGIADDVTGRLLYHKPKGEIRALEGLFTLRSNRTVESKLRRIP